MTFNAHNRRPASAWSPLSPFETMERVVDEWLGNRNSQGVSLRPPMDVREDDDKLVVTMELPGMVKDQIDVTLENGVLTLAGEKLVVRDESTSKYHASERRAGNFRRAVTLPTDVDVEKADAQFENGVLVVTVPKTESVKPKRLNIR